MNVKLFGLSSAIALALGSATPASAGTAFVHLFEWKWNDIAAECENFLGPKGFDAVQISPPQEHVAGPNWWTRYQPISFTNLSSRSGNEEELRNMIRRCNAAGVKIYADVVMNNWANNLDHGNISSGGRSWSPFNYPDLRPGDFHNSSNNCRISNYRDENNVWYCGLYSMPDLRTSNGPQQDYAADYMKRLTAMGVAGFRIDAAKHIKPSELDAIMAKAGRPWAFLEVIGAPNESPALAPSNYTYINQVTEFKYGQDVKANFDRQIKNLRTFGSSWGLLPSDKATVFIVNHDRERGHGGGGMYTYKDGAQYNLANIFMLAFPYGYPALMSGYKFTDTEAGPPAQGPNNCTNNAWNCDHRWANIANMVGFRNFTQSAWSVNNWWDNGSNAIAFSRGNRGFVLINNENFSISQTLQTGLPAGSYCNIMAGADACSGSNITVGSDGRASFSVAAKSAVAIHGGARPCSGSDCPVEKNLPSLSLRGTFNSWGNTPMSFANGEWSATVNFTGVSNQRFKFDVSGDWSRNYGDINSDGTLELGGGDIFTSVNGTYLVKVNDKSLSYSLTPVTSNLKPTAEITPATVTVKVGDSVTFSASGSKDTDGSIVAYDWSTGGTEVSETIEFFDVGTQTVTVTVTDDDGATAQASATVVVEDGNSTYTSNFASLNFRGTANSWGTQKMVLVANNTWQTRVSFDGQSNQRFKFDVTGNWSHNYGDSNADGIAERTGADIRTGVVGDYIVTFSDASLRYSLQRADGNFAKVYDSLYFRGTPNNWGTTAMQLVADNTWQVEVVFNGASGQRFKFDVAGNWATNFGDNNADGIAEQTGSDIATSVSGTYLVSFNDSTRRYRVVAK